MKTIQRTFIPGSKWIYIKLYTGTKTADTILIKDIFFIKNKLISMNLIDKWFFIRYNDPDFHLRIRVLLKDISCFGYVINLFYSRINSLVDEKMLLNLQIDTYNREIERYGLLFIEEAESIFYVDSECVLSILKKINNKDENYRWMIALKMIDNLLSDFSFDIFQKSDIMGKLSNSFKTEFGFNLYNVKQFNQKYRNNKADIERVLNSELIDEDFKKMYFYLRIRSKRIQPIIRIIKLKMNSSKNNISYEYLLTNCIHMMLNRLFRSKNRLHELILYDFMCRFYKSEVVRSFNIQK